MSPLACDQLQVSLPYSLSFSGSVSGTIADKNGAGTGFTVVDAYSGTRHSDDGTPSSTSAPGYEASKLTVTGGRLQLATNKGIAYVGNNNQLNTLGVRVDSRSRLTVEVTLVNPYYGTSSQQGGLWLGLNDKTHVKLVVVGNQVELRREVNDGSSSSDQRITPAVSGINSSTVRLRLAVDPATSTAEGFYSLNGGAEQPVGTALSISGMGLTSTTAYTGLFATHRNGTSSLTYTFDDFSVKGSTPSGNKPPVFTSGSYTYTVSDHAAIGTTVGTVTASDPEGKSVAYAITAGNTNGAFAINSSTGAIKVAKSLNYHTQSNYSLTIQASDVEGGYGTATVAFTISAGTAAPAFNSITWETAASQPFSVSEAQGEVVDGKLYTFGGFDSQKSCCTPTSRAYVYDPVANNWSAIASMPPMNGTSYGGVTHAGFATDGTDIYFAGGYTANSSGAGQIFGTKEVWKYSVSENRYIRLPDLPIPISAGQLEYLNGKLHHIAGTNQARTQDLGNHYVLDLDNLNTGWKTLAALPNPRQHAGSAVVEGKIYFIGGQTGHDSHLSTSKEVHRYEPATDSWTKVADLPVPTGTNGRGHISSSVIVIGERILVLGGETVHNSGRTNLVSEYSPTSNSWRNLTGLPSSRYSGVSAFLNSTIYYTSGSNSSTTFKGVPEQLTSSQKVESFTLINASTKQDILTLTDGSTLNLATLPTTNLNIRANTSPATVGSVVFTLSGTESKKVTENVAPYDLMGDKGAWTPVAGSYTLKATPYSSSNGGGTAGSALEISFSVVNQNTTSSTVLINSGGFMYVDGQSRTWDADAYYSGGITSSKSFDVAGTTDDEIYLKYRYASSGAPFNYNLPVDGTGPYTVKLHFVEPFFGAPGGKTTGLAGARVFHVDIEGQRVVSNYDIYSQDGAAKAIVKTFHDVSVTDGMLNILFTSVKDNAIISAIEVIHETSTMLMSTVQDERDQNLKLQVYPNPSTGDRVHLALEGFKQQERVNIVLYDMAGRAILATAVKTDQQGGSNTEMSISSNLANGMYIIKAQSATREVRAKLLLK
ncbi:malectin domain-containing carbohydrate-binding protein [Pontibacter pamirensis]|uniref:malectin domain-containing carbohydrate-binding protein n=1 Tax=Pontibacter pamirensis TaxID=2562824 RepID=UPI00138A313B|nr:malectin domain-containing carbohydrate-binding protein [Pontibacter pamirensis]